MCASKLNKKSLKELTAIYNDKSGKSITLLKCSKTKAVEKIMDLEPSTMPGKTIGKVKDELDKMVNSAVKEIKKEKKVKKEKVASKRSILVKLIKSGIDEIGELFEAAIELKDTITEKDVKWTLKFYQRALNI